MRQISQTTRMKPATSRVDSQMQSLSPSSQINASTMPSELDDLDPFARVGKNRDA